MTMTMEEMAREHLIFHQAEVSTPEEILLEDRFNEIVAILKENGIEHRIRQDNYERAIVFSIVVPPDRFDMAEMLVCS